MKQQTLLLMICSQRLSDRGGIMYKITMLNDYAHYFKDYRYIDSQTIIIYPQGHIIDLDMIKIGIEII